MNELNFCLLNQYHIDYYIEDVSLTWTWYNGKKTHIKNPHYFGDLSGIVLLYNNTIIYTEHSELKINNNGNISIIYDNYIDHMEEIYQFIIIMRIFQYSPTMAVYYSHRITNDNKIKLDFKNPHIGLFGPYKSDNNGMIPIKFTSLTMVNLYEKCMNNVFINAMLVDKKTEDKELNDIVNGVSEISDKSFILMPLIIKHINMITTCSNDYGIYQYYAWLEQFNDENNISNLISSISESIDSFNST